MMTLLLSSIVLSAPALDARAPTPVSACAAGDADACLALPAYLLERYGLLESVVERCSTSTNGALCLSAGLALSEINPAYGDALLERSCALGFDRGCAEWVRRLSESSPDRRRTRDLSRALAVLGPRCEKRAAQSPCDSLRTRPLWNVPSIERAQADCDEDDAAACHALGVTFMGDLGIAISEADYARTRRSLERACTKGHADACLDFGSLLEAGQGQPKDLDGARSAFADACDAGSSSACERHELLDLPLKGCNHGDGTACAELARGYGAPPSHEKDLVRAGEFWDRACELTPVACREAGDAYRLGLGVLPELDRALAFYRRGGERDVTRRYDDAKRGCEEGLAPACIRLGDLYYGDPAGIPLEPNRARSHYARACELTDGEVCQRLRERYQPPGS